MFLSVMYGPHFKAMWAQFGSPCGKIKTHLCVIAVGAFLGFFS